MKEILLAIFTSLSICACTAINEAAMPIAAPPSTSNDGGKAATLVTLKTELEALADNDAKAREGYKPDVVMDQKTMYAMWEKMQILDTANQLRLDEIVKQHGWPEKKDVGAKAAYAAFIVVQHAPREYMQRYFPMVQKSMERGDLSKNSFAMFDDRLRMEYGHAQRYGTQLNTDGKGVRTFWPIEDEANVDKRRAEVGYEPMAEYAKRFKVPYVPYAERIATETSKD
jgi:hypothetical protein